MCKFDERLAAADLANPHWVVEEINNVSFGNC